MKCFQKVGGDNGSGYSMKIDKQVTPGNNAEYDPWVRLCFFGFLMHAYRPIFYKDSAESAFTAFSLYAMDKVKRKGMFFHNPLFPGPVTSAVDK